MTTEKNIRALLSNSELINYRPATESHSSNTDSFSVAYFL